MSRFRVNVVARNPKDEAQVSAPIEALVDTGSELSWLPAQQMTAIGVEPRRKRTFVPATKEVVERDVGYAVLTAEGFETVDEVVFAKKNDLCLLGVRTLEGFGVTVDNVSHRFVAVTTVAATNTLNRR
jgi:predicted aspartyl protease